MVHIVGLWSEQFPRLIVAEDFNCLPFFLFLGPENSFVDICKTQHNQLAFHPSVDKFLDLGAFVQFRVCAFNIVGQGSWCSPAGIKVPDEYSMSSVPSSVSSVEDAKRMRSALSRENFVCWNDSGKCK